MLQGKKLSITHSLLVLHVRVPARNIKELCKIKEHIWHTSNINYLIDQGVLSQMRHEHTHLGKMNQQLYINRIKEEAYNQA